MELCPAARACHLPLGFGFLELVRLQVDSVRPGDLEAWSPSVSEPGGGWGANNEAFSQGSRRAGRGKAICPRPQAPRAAGRERGCGRWCQALAGAAGRLGQPGAG